MWPLTMWMEVCFSLFGLDKFSGSWVTASLWSVHPSWFGSDLGKAADTSKRGEIVREKKSVDKDKNKCEPQREAVSDTEKLYTH